MHQDRRGRDNAHPTAARWETSGGLCPTEESQGSQKPRRFRVGGSEEMPNVAQRLACKTSEMEPVICGGNARWSICMTLRLLSVHEHLLQRYPMNRQLHMGVIGVRESDLVRFRRLTRSEHGCESFGAIPNLEPSEPTVGLGMGIGSSSAAFS
jgi:hypothetical protein